MHRRVTALLVALGIALSGCAPHTSVTSSQDTADTTLTVLAASSTRVINDELTERAGQLESPVNLIDIPGAEKFSNQILGAVATDASHPDQARAVLNLLASDFDSTWHHLGFSPAK